MQQEQCCIKKLSSERLVSFVPVKEEGFPSHRRLFRRPHRLIGVSSWQEHELLTRLSARPLSRFNHEALRVSCQSFTSPALMSVMLVWKVTVTVHLCVCWVSNRFNRLSSFCINQIVSNLLHRYMKHQGKLTLITIQLLLNRSKIYTSFSACRDSYVL